MSIKDMLSSPKDKPKILVVGDSTDDSKLLERLREEFSEYEFTVDPKEWGALPLIDCEGHKPIPGIIGGGKVDSARLLAELEMKRCLIDESKRARALPLIDYPPRLKVAYEFDEPHIVNEIQKIELISDNSAYITARHEISPYGNRKQRRTQMAKYRKKQRSKK